MYIYERFFEIELYNEVENLVEDDELPPNTITKAINIYLNSKPGTWRLISYNTDSSTYQFIWLTGE